MESNRKVRYIHHKANKEILVPTIVNRRRFICRQLRWYWIIYMDPGLYGYCHINYKFLSN